MNFLRKSTLGVTIDNDSNQEISVGLKEYIDTLCISSLSTMKGRRDAAKVILKTNRLLPIYINEETLLFPTGSLRNYDVVLINYINVLRIMKTNNDNCKIIFQDNQIIEPNISLNRVRNQLYRCEQLLAYCKKL